MIANLSIHQQSLLMATFSNLSYYDDQLFHDLGYESFFLNCDGSQAYFLWDETDVIVVCRGTQPSEFKDIVADIRFQLTPSSSGHGMVHFGFKRNVDLIWPVLEPLLIEYGRERWVWCTGHSMGAAMATLISARCYRYEKVPSPILFTYGSPKVGNAEYISFMKSLNIVHYRWVNNVDIVTRSPTGKYNHHGDLYYFDHTGNITNKTISKSFKDILFGLLRGIRNGRINFFGNHSILVYIANLENHIKKLEK